MLAELVTTIAELAEQGNKHPAKVDKHPTDPDQVLIITDDGKVEFRAAPRVNPDRQHRVDSFTDLLSAYIQLAAVGNATDPDQPILGRAIIWHNDKQVLFFTDDPARRNKVTLDLVYSELWPLAQRFSKQQSLEQKEFVRLLRHDWERAVDPGVLAPFREINWSVLSRAGGKINHGEARLDSDLQAAVADAAGKPTGFIVNFDMLAMADIECRVQVPMTIDLDAASQKIIVQAAPDSLVACKNALREAVGRTIDAHLTTRGIEAATVIAGTP